MSLIPYYLIERGVYSLFNAIDAPSVTALQTNITKTTLVKDVDLTNAALSPFTVQLEICNAQELLASMICRTEGHPRRYNFVTVSQLSNGDPLPSMVGGIGAVYDANGIPMIPVDTERIWTIKSSQASSMFAGTDTHRDLYYAIDGVKIYHALPGAEKARVESFTYVAPYSSFSTLAALFDVTVPVPSMLHNEFQPAWEYLAAGLIASKIGMYRSESAEYLAMGQQMAQANGIAVHIPLDYRGAAPQ